MARLGEPSGYRQRTEYPDGSAALAIGLGTTAGT